MAVWMPVSYTHLDVYKRQILTKIRRDAESYLGEPVTEAVITVPAYFEMCIRDRYSWAATLTAATMRLHTTKKP